MTVPASAHHAHAVLHCNLNTADVESAAAFHILVFGCEPRMRSVSVDGDATAMGLATSTASVTAFLYDPRGPRSAPALELVGWLRPRTETAPPGMVGSAFAALGFRVASLAVFEQRLATIGLTATAVVGGLPVRGKVYPALRLTDTDGVAVEVVEIPSVDADLRRVALLSHERMRCSDLKRTVEWYVALGWRVWSRGAGVDGPTASLLLPEDPTFSLEFEQNGIPSGSPRPANTRGLYRIALAVEDVRAAHAELVEAGTLGDVPDPVAIPMPDIPTGGFTVLFLADPDGAVVELVERPRSALRRPSAAATA